MAPPRRRATGDGKAIQPCVARTGTLGAIGAIVAPIPANCYENVSDTCARLTCRLRAVS